MNIILKVSERDVCSLKQIHFLLFNLGHRWKQFSFSCTWQMKMERNYEVVEKWKQQPIRTLATDSAEDPARVGE